MMVKQILIGLKAYTQSLKIISKLNLWSYFIIPILISLITAALIGFSAYTWSDNITDFITSLFPGWNPPNWLRTIEIFFFGALIIVLGLVLYKHIVMALSAPFMSPVSEKIEAHLYSDLHKDHRNTSFIEQLWRGVRINTRNLLKELLISVPILLLGLLPIIGLFSTILLFLVQAYYAGFGNMDYTLERHFNYKESVKFVRRHKGLAIGNGSIFMLLLLLPVFGVILVLPLSVVAATKITLNEMNQEQ